MPLLQKNVHFLGYQNKEKTLSIIRGSDLLIQPSRMEGGLSYTLLESMACGVPLVSTKVGQATDLIKHGWNGWLADIGDYEGIANQAKNVLEQKNSISKILVNGRTTAERNSAISLVPMWKNFFEGFVNF